MVKTTYEDVKMFVEDSSKCKLLSTTYVKNNIKLKFLCECGNEFETDFSTFKHKNKRQCDKCGIKNRAVKKSYTDEEIKELVENETKLEYKLLDLKFEKSKNSDKLIRKIKIEHVACGRVKWMNLSNWTKGGRCKPCAMSESTKISKEELIRRVETETDNEFKFIDVFYKTRSDNGRNEGYLKIKHWDCGYEFEKTIGSWGSQKSCPRCVGMMKVSYLHAVISLLFEKYYKRVEFEKDIGFKGDKGGKSKYDLYVPNYKGKNTLFEFQSRFHDGKEDFDNRKKNFAINKGYELIAIDHRDVALLDIIKDLFPTLDSIPEWIDDELHRFKKLNLSKAQNLLDQNYTYIEIANVLRTTESTVSHAVRDGRLIRNDKQNQIAV